MNPIRKAIPIARPINNQQYPPGRAPKPAMPLRPRRRWHAPALAALVGCGALACIGLWAWSELPPDDPAPAAFPIAAGFAPHAIRGHAWDNVQGRVAAADRASQEALNSQLAQLDGFFARGQSGARPFAEEILSWGGKWQYLKTRIGEDGDRQYAQYVREQFDRHVFTDHDLQQAVRAAAEGYVSRLQGLENQLLIDLQADLSDQALPFARAIPALQSDEQFQAGYRKLLGEVAPRVGSELGVTAGREIIMLVTTEIATNLVVRTLATAVPGVLGPNGTLGGTIPSAAVTLGLGIVIGFAVDCVLDWVLRHVFGRDPEGDVAAQVTATVGNLRRSLVEGSGGLRQELIRLHELRSRLRREALKQLILEGGQ